MITNERRFFGPGLPPAGVTDATDAYRLGLAHARREAIAVAFSGSRNEGISIRAISEQYDELVRTVASATDRFIEENGTLLSALERELRHGAELEEQPDAIAERIREREMDEDHAQQVAEGFMESELIEGLTKAERRAIFDRGERTI